MSTVTAAFAPASVRPHFKDSSLKCWERETWAAMIVSYLAENGNVWGDVWLSSLMEFGHRRDHSDWDRLLVHDQGRMLAGLMGLVKEGYLGARDERGSRCVFVQQPMIAFYQGYIG